VLLYILSILGLPSRIFKEFLLLYKEPLVLWTKIVLFKCIKVTLSIYIKGRLFLNCYTKYKILAILSYIIIK